MRKLTIFTPAFNRGYIIEKLYRSLQRQRVFDFEWLVVNDGSTDDTDELFQLWLKEDNQFPIRYFKQENKGLMAAFNKGVELAAGEYLSKIDSDDYVSDDYAETVIEWLKSIKGNDELYAVGGVRGTNEGIPIKGAGEWPLVDKEMGYVDIYEYQRAQYNLDADMSEAWRVSVLKSHRFPEFEGEKYAPEAIVLNGIALEGYKIRWFAKIICTCEYQSDGITRNDMLVQKNNPLGFSMAWKCKLKLKLAFKQKVFCLCQAEALAMYGGRPGEIWKDNEHKLLSVLVLPLAFCVYLRRRRQFKQF